MWWYPKLLTGFRPSPSPPVPGKALRIMLEEKLIKKIKLTEISNEQPTAFKTISIDQLYCILWPPGLLAKES